MRQNGTSWQTSVFLLQGTARPAPLKPRTLGPAAGGVLPRALNIKLRRRLGAFQGQLVLSVPSTSTRRSKPPFICCQQISSRLFRKTKGSFYVIVSSSCLSGHETRRFEKSDVVEDVESCRLSQPAQSIDLDPASASALARYKVAHATSNSRRRRRVQGSMSFLHVQFTPQLHRHRLCCIPKIPAR